MLKVAAALDNDSATNIDLSATIGGVKRVNANSLYPDQFHWLPQEYCFNAADYRTKTIVPMFVQACASAGFHIAAKGWEAGPRLLRFRCIRGRKFTPENGNPIGCSKLCGLWRETKQPAGLTSQYGGIMITIGGSCQRSRLVVYAIMAMFNYVTMEQNSH
jgi:hypothetical protein